VSLLASVQGLLRLLQQHGAHGCLVGGLAVSVRCDPRFTLDADVAVAVVNDAEAEACVRLLVQAVSWWLQLPHSRQLVDSPW